MSTKKRLIVWLLILLFLFPLICFAGLYFDPSWWFAPFYEAAGPVKQINVSFSKTPDQEFALPDNMKVQIYDALSVKDSVAIRLLSSNNETIWTVLPEYYDGYTLQSVRFEKAFRLPGGAIRIRGYLHDRENHKHAILWIIDRNTKASKFYYNT